MSMGRLRDKLILLSLVLIIPFLIWNILLHRANYRHEYSVVIDSQHDTASGVASALASQVYNLVSLERTVGIALWGDQRIPSEEASAYLSNVSRSFPLIRNLSAADADGVIFASDNPALIGLSRANTPAVRAVIQGADWRLSNVFTSAVEQAQVFGVVTGIRDANGRLIGMILAIMDEQSLESTLLQRIVGAEEIVITDASGIVALSSGVQELGPRQRDWSGLAFIRRALNGRTSYIDHLQMPDGTIMMGAVVPVRNLGWTAGAFYGRQRLVTPISRAAILNGSLIALLMGLFIGMAYYFGNRITQPVMDLTNTASALGQGDFGARANVHTHDELDILAQSLNDMALSLQQRTDELNSALASERQQSERSSALYSVAHGIVTTMDLDSRLRVIAHALAMITRTGRCAIFLKSGNRLVGATGWNLVRMDLFRDLSYDISASGEIAMRVIVDRGPLLVPCVAESPNIAEQDKMILAELGVKGFLALPLVWKQRLVGVATLDTPEMTPSFDEESLENARSLADLAAIAIENAQLFEKEKNIAHTLQESLLPEYCGRISEYEIACEYHAALEVSQLGGDLYDIIEHPEGKIGIVVADVSGKGLEAGVFTAMSKYTLRAYASEDPDPAAALCRTNNALSQVSGEWGFVTMVYGLLDTHTGEMITANAGHPPSVIVRASGESLVLRYDVHDLPLGVMRDERYCRSKVTLESGDIFAAYTDGVMEARRDGEPFEVERLTDVLREARHLSAKEIARHVYEAVLDYSRGSLQDDIALIIVKRG